AVRACGAADRLAVHRDSGQPARRRDREGDRPGRGAAGQERPGQVSQLPGADQREDPHDGVRVRRHARPQGVAPAPGRGQHLRRRGRYPGGDVLQRRAPAQHRCRAHRQDRRQRMPYPARVPGIGDGREAGQQPPAAGRMQAGRMSGQLAQGILSGSGHGHARLGGPRGPRQRKGGFTNPLARPARALAPPAAAGLFGAVAFGVTGAIAGEAASTSAHNQGGGKGNTATPIKHLVVIFDENVSFDHYFGTYPYAPNPPGEPAFHARTGTPTVNVLYNDLTSSGQPAGPLLTSNTNLSNPVRLGHDIPLTCDQDHDYTAEQLAADHGAEDAYPANTGGNLTLTQCLAGFDYPPGTPELPPPGT